MMLLLSRSEESLFFLLRAASRLKPESGCIFERPLRVDKRPSVRWSIACRQWSVHLPEVVSCGGNAWSAGWQYAPTLQ